MYGGLNVWPKHRRVGGTFKCPGGAHELTGCQVLSMTSCNYLENEWLSPRVKASSLRIYKHKGTPCGVSHLSKGTEAGLPSL